MESSTHLFFRYEVAKTIWSLVARWSGVVFSFSISMREWLSMVDDYYLTNEKMKCLEVIVLITCWILWRLRNLMVFEDVPFLSIVFC